MTETAFDSRIDENIIDKELLLEARQLKKYFPIKRGVFRKTVGYTKAVDGVDFFLKKGETLGLVGESGCGKTTTGMCILRIMEITDGDIYYNYKGSRINLTELDNKEMKKLRREIQVIFQDPYSSLNPRMSVGEIVGEPLVVHGVSTGRKKEEKVIDLLESVGLKASYLKRYPHEFSGGQRQRIGIARALALDPGLIICDEPVSALDVSVQAQIINLFKDLQQQYGLAYLFIAHDLSVVEYISNRIAVMYLGKIVEMTTSEELYNNPQHPYTEALLSAIPIPDPDIKKEKILLEGNVPDPSNPPQGCNFHPRCRYVRDICRQKEPDLDNIEGNNEHFISCHLYKELKLKGYETAN